MISVDGRHHQHREDHAHQDLLPGNRSTPKAKPASTEVTRHRITVQAAMKTVLRNSRGQVRQRPRRASSSPSATAAPGRRPARIAVPVCSEITNTQ